MKVWLDNTPLIRESAFPFFVEHEYIKITNVFSCFLYQVLLQMSRVFYSDRCVFNGWFCSLDLLIRLHQPHSEAVTAHNLPTKLRAEPCFLNPGCSPVTRTLDQHFVKLVLICPSIPEFLFDLGRDL